MNQLITITFLFVMSFSIGFSQTPAVLKINNNVQVTFPDLYKENSIRNTTVYKLKLADSTATLSAIAQDFSLRVNSIEEKEDHFEVQWESFYKLGENKIHNVLTSKIKFQDDKIQSF